jgi:hypothetical protein
MVDSISGLTNTAVALQQQKLSENVNTAVLKKTQDVQVQQGQAVVRSRKNPSGNRCARLISQPFPDAAS